MTPLITPTTIWHCLGCGLEDVTHDARPHSRMHICAASGGLTMPMLPQHERAKVEIREREDYIGSEIVQLFNGRPVMSVVTTRDDGQDAIVFAPTATARGDT